MSLSEFVMSCQEITVNGGPADRRAFTLPPADWDDLVERLNRPADQKPRLAALLAEPSVLERDLQGDR